MSSIRESAMKSYSKGKSKASSKPISQSERADLQFSVLDLASKVAKGERKKIIKPRHISLAMKNDAELSKLLEGVIIPCSGGVLKIQNNLSPNNNAESEARNT
ncbi:hypothetical protein ACS0TY_007711 [Phlomoides rotata]